MNDLMLNDVRKFNADLVTVCAAGVPVDIGFDSQLSPTALQTELQRLEVTLTNLCTGDAPVSDMLRHNPQFPLQYVTTLQHWLDVQGAPIAFEPSSAASASERRRQGRAAINLVHPASWLCLAYVAMVIVCGGLVPMFEAQYRQMWAAPGPVLSLLGVLRHWMPVWLIAFPVTFVVGIVALHRHRQQRSSKQPHGLSQAEALRRAQLAEQASHMLAQGLPPQQVLTVLRQRVQMPGPAPQFAPSSATADRSGTLPPLLEWAAARLPLEIVDAASPSALPPASSDAFQRAASIYRAIAQQLQQSRVSQRPLRIAMVVVGGLLVLGVALSVFGPLVEMLLFLTDPTIH